MKNKQQFFGYNVWSITFQEKLNFIDNIMPQMKRFKYRSKGNSLTLYTRVTPKDMKLHAHLKASWRPIQTVLDFVRANQKFPHSTLKVYFICSRTGPSEAGQQGRLELPHFCAFHLTFDRSNYNIMRVRVPRPLHQKTWGWPGNEAT